MFFFFSQFFQYCTQKSTTMLDWVIYFTRLIVFVPLLQYMTTPRNGDMYMHVAHWWQSLLIAVTQEMILWKNRTLWLLCSWSSTETNLTNINGSGCSYVSLKINNYNVYANCVFVTNIIPCSHIPHVWKREAYWFPSGVGGNVCNSLCSKSFRSKLFKCGYSPYDNIVTLKANYNWIGTPNITSTKYFKSVWYYWWWWFVKIMWEKGLFV